MSRLKLAVGMAVLALAAIAVRPLFARLTSSPARDLDPAAITALTRMGAYLDRLERFQVDAVISRDQVLGDGQKLQYDSRVSLLAARPNRLRIVVEGDRHERTLVFDGKTFTMWAPRLNLYAAVSAPATIGALADTLEVRYDVEMPLVDLFRWGHAEASIERLTSARAVGASEACDVPCSQYAFRQSGLDWQIWIQDGDKPLPRRVVLTTLADDTRPQHSATYTWNLTPVVADTEFAFSPPPEARRVGLSEANSPRLTNRR